MIMLVHELGKLQIRPNLPFCDSVDERIVLSLLFSLSLLFRFFHRTLLFTDGVWDESSIWINQLETSGLCFAQFLLAVLQNACLYPIQFVTAAVQEISPSSDEFADSVTNLHPKALSDNCPDNLNLQRLCHSLPLSVFSIAVIYHWRKHLPSQLAPRHLYLSFPQLPNWKVSSEQMYSKIPSEVARILKPTEICPLIAKAMKTICIRRGQAATSAIQSLVSNETWKNIFCDPRKIDDSDHNVKRAIKQAKQSIREYRSELLQDLPTSSTTIISPFKVALTELTSPKGIITEENEKEKACAAESNCPIEEENEKGRKKTKPLFNYNIFYSEGFGDAVTKQAVCKIILKLLKLLKKETTPDCDLQSVGVEFTNLLSDMGVNEFLDLMCSSTCDEENVGVQIEK